MVRQTDGLREEHKCRRVDRRIGRQMDRQMEGQTNRKTYRQTEGQIKTNQAAKAEKSDKKDEMTANIERDKTNTGFRDDEQQLRYSSSKNC